MIRHKLIKNSNENMYEDGRIEVFKYIAHIEALFILLQSTVWTCVWLIAVDVAMVFKWFVDRLSRFFLNENDAFSQSPS